MYGMSIDKVSESFDRKGYIMENNNKETVYAFMRSYNKVEGFNPERAAVQAVSVYNGTQNEIQILPADVKKAWFRMVYPQGHTEDEQFGTCDDTVANVKVTVYATGDSSQELSHAYASKVFDPTSVSDSVIPEASRALYLYRTAVGMAKSTAMTEAGIGMGYYQSVREYKDATDEGIDAAATKIVSPSENIQNAKGASMPNESHTVCDTEAIQTHVEPSASMPKENVSVKTVPVKTEAVSDTKVKTRRSAAEVVEERMNLLEESIERMNELTAAASQAGINDVLKAELDSALGKEEITAATHAEYIDKQIAKAERNNNSSVLNVVSREFFENAISNAPVNSSLRAMYGSKETTVEEQMTANQHMTTVEAEFKMAEAQTIEEVAETGRITESEPETEKKVYQMNLFPDEDITEEEIDTNVDDKAMNAPISDYKLTSTGIGKYSGAILDELTLDELKFLLVKATRGLLNEQDTKQTIARIRSDFPDQIEVCKRRCPELF